MHARVVFDLAHSALWLQWAHGARAALAQVNGANLIGVPLDIFRI